MKLNHISKTLIFSKIPIIAQYVVKVLDEIVMSSKSLSKFPIIPIFVKNIKYISHRLFPRIIPGLMVGILLAGTPLTFSAALNGNLVYGNTRTSLFGGKVGLGRDVYPWEYEISFSGSYGTTEVGDSTAITANNGRGMLRVDRYVTERVEVFVFGSSEYDRVMNLGNRTQGGAGAKYVFLNRDGSKVSVSAALLGGYEKFVGDTVSRYPVRLSVRPKGKFNFGPFGTLSFILFYQPNLLDFANDYRVFGDVTYSVALTQTLAFNVILKYNYDGYVAVQSKDSTSSLYGVKPYDLNLLLGLSMKVPLER